MERRQQVRFISMQTKKVIIIGSHPIRQSLWRQYTDNRCEIKEVEDEAAIRVEDFHKCKELVLMPLPDEDDNGTIELLKRLAKRVEKKKDGERPIVHLLLQSPTSLWMLQTMDLPDEVKDAFDVYPFTMEDVWAKNILVHLPGISDSGYPRLDRKSIDAASRQTVHMVISGFDEQAKAVAIHAALVAHFPNYNGNDELPLRTRITIIDNNIETQRDNFIAMYQHLFDNSFYRFVDLKNQKVILHRPMYYGKRKDFVDVEWEFVDANINSESVRQKLSLWAQSDRQQLTVVVSHDIDEKNLALCVSLPTEIYERHIPVFVRQSRIGLAASMKHTYVYNNVYPFGMSDCGYDVTLPLVRLAKMLGYFYNYSYSHEHKDGRQDIPTILPMADAEKVWHDERSYKNRLSSICNVMTISTKMHSLGHDAADIDKFYALTVNEITSLAETEHNRWSVERLIMGVRPCTDEEKTKIRASINEIIEAKEQDKGKIGNLKKKYKKQFDIHYDLCSFSELERDEKGNDVVMYDLNLTACIPLMAKTFYDENDGRE